jgi:hypothetical protein
MDASYLSQQVNTIIGQLHGLFDEIGVASHDRETREAEVRRHYYYSNFHFFPLIPYSLLCHVHDKWLTRASSSSQPSPKL